MLILCGHYPQRHSESSNSKRDEGKAANNTHKNNTIFQAYYPNLELPINYIDLSENEVNFCNEFFNEL